MKLIVGLGNPGEKYERNRHNVGWLVVDELEKLGLKGFKLFKPGGFMNQSGVGVKQWLKKLGEVDLESLYVVHDDLDIKLGEFKISFGKGPKDHNGLKSVYEQLGSKDFWHVRLGIDGDREGKTGEELIWEWLAKYEISSYIKEITCEKPRAIVYIDDRGIRFESWEQTLKQFNEIYNK